MVTTNARSKPSDFGGGPLASTIRADCTRSADAIKQTTQLEHFQEGSEAMIALEAMVDHATIRNVVWALAHICWDKADHVRTNWQDKALARDWERNARVLDKIASSLDSIP